jgi:hypothetical protein
MKQVVIALAVAATLSGCASIVERDDAQIVPGTVSVRPYGMNYKISALVEASGDRKPVEIVATDCEKGHADYIWDGSAILESVAKNAILNGNTPKDKMFTQLCKQGYPLAQAMNDRVTPEQRDATLRAMYQMELERARRPVVVQPAPVIVQPAAPSSVDCTSNRVGTFTYTNCR